MLRFFSYCFFPCLLFLHAFSPVIDSLDKAKEMAKLYDKPIICFFDDTLADEKRGDLAREYFAHPSIYVPFSSTHIFTHCKDGQKGISGFMILSKSGEVLKSVNTYNDFKVLADTIAKFSFLKKS